MSVIYITGDCHGGFQRFTTKNFPLIQSGDSTAAAFPVKKIELTDVFGHAWLF